MGADLALYRRIGASRSLCSSVLMKRQRVVMEAYVLFKDYLRHWAMITTTALVVVLACALKGDLMFVGLLAYKTYVSNLHGIGTSKQRGATGNASSNGTAAEESNTAGGYQPILPDYLQILPEAYNMKDILFYVAIAVLSSIIMMHAISGFFQVYYYTLQRDNPEKWKCQPHRFLTRSNELHEIVVGTLNVSIGGVVSGIVTCWIANGNFTTMYFKIDEYGYPYFFVSFLLFYIWIEASAYYSHAFTHIPLLYKLIHKQHHRYHSPTAYSVVAMSPFEFLLNQSYLIVPIFTVPMNAFMYITIILYIYYFGLMDHSGVKMESWFPWQPSSMFHDDHHRYFHCNFGFNSYLFDWLHGTIRQKDRIYGEDVFGGKGKEKTH